MEKVKECLLYADIAFSNKQYIEALTWYKKALSTEPSNFYALSRAGAICVSISQFDDALKYFGKAKDLDPENGDNCFNYANACFFNKDYTNAFLMYVEAEQKGCSDDVTPRLYYQMAMLCSMRHDIKSSLAYFKKCEDYDKSGMIAINPDLISEKLKLFMMIQDYENAEKCATQLVAIQPIVFKNYMVLFSILMAHKKYIDAEKALKDAEQYAELTNDDQTTLVLQMAALLIAKGAIEGSQYYNKAIELLESYCKSENLTREQKLNALITLSEAYLKSELFDKAICCLGSLLSSDNKAINSPIDETPESVDYSSEDIETMIQEDLERIQDKINCGEIDDNIGMYAEIEYDEDGNERHVYDESVFSSVYTNQKELIDDSVELKNTETTELSIAVREKIQFTLLSAFLGKEDFVNVLKIASILKHSENKYYAYYGLYTSALATRKISDSKTSIEQKYAETIAFFRNKTFADPSDVLATIFRARLYAEQGRKEKAKELANLLSDNDKQAILEYIDQC